MPKQKSVFVCQSCAYESPQWVGQCPQCSEWNTFEETLVVKSTITISKSSISSSKPVLLSSVKESALTRLSSNISEFDRVLGGGFVFGQVVLLAGEPGVGKSTLLTQIAKSLKKKILYVCGEESMEQVKLRAQRMRFDAKELLMLPETNVDVITSVITSLTDVKLVIIDSIQTLGTTNLTGAPGSIGQVRACTQLLTEVAKRVGIPLVLVGHVTKEGAVAGPKVLEHIVDTVLYLEGDSQHLYRVLKTTKNRFGPVSEVGVFEMNELGMSEITNPSELFLDQRDATAPGSCVTVVMEGFRPLLFEVQALTTKTSFGYPRRTATGFSVARLQVLLAILEKRGGLNLSDQDVYVSIAGGFKVSEYACDLAVCLAIASSIKNKPVSKKTAVFGECGLAGEVRRVSHQDKRVREAKKMGFSIVLSPETVKSVRQALNLVL